MIRDDDDARGFAAVGKRDPEGCRGGDAGSDAGHDLKRHAGRLQRVDFLGEAAKNAGVASFEADYVQALACSQDHALVDFSLRGTLGTEALSDTGDARAGWGQSKDGLRNEVVVQNDCGSGDQAMGFHGEQVGITRACADKIDLADGRFRGLLAAFHFAASRIELDIRLLDERKPVKETGE